MNTNHRSKRRRPAAQGTQYSDMKGLRKLCRLTLLSAAKRAGISHSYLWEIEEGFVAAIRSVDIQRRIDALRRWYRRQLVD